MYSHSYLKKQNKKHANEVNMWQMQNVHHLSSLIPIWSPADPHDRISRGPFWTGHQSTAGPAKQASQIRVLNQTESTLVLSYGATIICLYKYTLIHLTSRMIDQHRSESSDLLKCIIFHMKEKLFKSCKHNSNQCCEIKTYPSIILDSLKIKYQKLKISKDLIIFIM